MKKNVIAIAMIVIATFVTGACSRNFSLVDQTSTSVDDLSIAEVFTTEAETTEIPVTVTEPAAIVITVPAETTAADTMETEETDISFESSEEESMVLESNQAIISYQAGEYIIIRIPEGYYEYSTDMTNYVTLMSDKTDDFYTIADYADTIIPSQVQENIGAEEISANCYIKMNDKGCDFYYFSETGHAVKITYTTYGAHYTEGYIDGIKSEEYLLKMAQSFVFQP